jgi:REP element-mobilizing transposase RayT
MYIKGKYYHVYNRGCNKEPIFFTEDNYRYLIKKFKQYSHQYEIEIFAYCLMPNHYHLLVKQKSDVSISKFIQVVFNGYSQAINKQENRSGTIFQGKAKGIEVVSEKQIISLLCYIHNNPAKTGLVHQAEDWEFSDYQEWIGMRKRESKNKLLSEYFYDKNSYRKFFIDYKDNKNLEFFLKTENN